MLYQLRCTGEKEGCRRCVSKQIQCVYVGGDARPKTKVDKPSKAQTSTPGYRGFKSAAFPDATIKKHATSAHGDDMGSMISAPTTSTALDEYDIDMEYDVHKSSGDTFVSDDSLSYIYSECPNEFFEMEKSLVDLGHDAETESFWDVSPSQPAGRLEIDDLIEPSDNQSNTLKHSVTTSNATHPHPSMLDLSPSADQSNLFRRPARPSAEPSGSEICRCPRVVALLLEAVNVRTTSLSHTSIISILRFSKQTLVRCQSLLHCEAHSFSPSFLLPLILLSQSLVGAYEKVLRLLAERSNQAATSTEGAKLHSLHVYRSVPSSATTSLNAKGSSLFNERFDQDIECEHSNLNLCDHGLDAEEELVVLGAITKMQLVKLKGFLRQFRRVLDGHEYDTHLNIIDTTSERIREQLEGLNNWPGSMVNV